MQFIKEHVPDKRWQDNKRPITVEGNPVLWFFWKIVVLIKNVAISIKLVLEKSFKEIEDLKEENNNVGE